MVAPGHNPAGIRGRIVTVTSPEAGFPLVATRFGPQFELSYTVRMDAKGQGAGSRQWDDLSDEGEKSAQPETHVRLALPSVPVGRTAWTFPSNLRITLSASFDQKRSPNE